MVTDMCIQRNGKWYLCTQYW